MGELSATIVLIFNMRATGICTIFITLSAVVLSLASNVAPPIKEEKKSKSVSTFVSAKWEATPIVLELAEYLSGESSDLFWSFVDGINSLKTSLEKYGKFNPQMCLN